MMLNYYFNEECFVEYLVGGLYEFGSLVIVTYLVFCVICCLVVDDLEVVGGVVLGFLVLMLVNGDSFVNVMVCLDDNEFELMVVSLFWVIGINVLSFLVDYFGSDFGLLVWNKKFGGVEEYVLLMGELLIKIFFLKMGVGNKLLFYIYCGIEMMLVFKGVYMDYLGKFCVGDFVELDDLVMY